MKFIAPVCCWLRSGAALLLVAVPHVAAAQAGNVLETPAPAETRTLLARAESMLTAGDADDAYALLRARERALSGNPLFDYLLGVAALDSGRTSEAIFSLQRALAVEPRFSGAKMELARAYFEAGENDQARPLFIALLDESPPPGIQRVITNYIARIDGRPAAGGSRFSPYAEFVAGYDTNANGSTDENQFLGFMLSPENIEAESPFAELAAGFTWTVPRSRNFGWYVGGRASHRNNPDADFVNTGTLSGFGGFSWQRGAGFGRLGIDGYGSLRDGDSNQAYAGIDALIGRRLGADWELSLSLRAGALLHESAIEVLDVDRLLYTLGLGYRPSPQSRLRVEAVGGSDNERNSGSPYGNTKTGIRTTFATAFGERRLIASIGFLNSDYDGLFFGTPREDEQLSAMLEIEFSDMLSRRLAIIPRIRYVENDSDVALYDYDRLELGVTFRWTPR